MEVNTCFFIGHRDAPEELRPLLAEAVERHITQYGVTEFIVGHYGRFDAMAASTVRAAKKQHSEISLVLLLPYFPYEYDAAEYDGSFYPPGMEMVPKQFAIVRANQYMIRHSDYLICYYEGYPGNTRSIVEAALRLEAAGRLRIEKIEKNDKKNNTE